MPNGRLGIQKNNVTVLTRTPAGKGAPGRAGNHQPPFAGLDHREATSGIRDPFGGEDAPLDHGLVPTS
ncbi:MAG: hypothetical protein IT438_13900 [Phycisphaerales bacterium]|nr:hypothetical protein [Phycisphaerales bacterium]